MFLRAVVDFPSFDFHAPRCLILASIRTPLHFYIPPHKFSMVGNMKKTFFIAMLIFLSAFLYARGTTISVGETVPLDGTAAPPSGNSSWEGSEILGSGALEETAGAPAPNGTAPDEQPQPDGQNLSSCGQFSDAEACPSLWQPVCAKIEKGISAPYEIEWKTFANSCTACASSTRMEVVAGYYAGECPPAPPQNETGNQPQPDGNGEPGADLCQSLFVLSGMALSLFVYRN
jgi:hypothetical protein